MECVQLLERKGRRVWRLENNKNLFLMLSTRSNGKIMFPPMHTHNFYPRNYFSRGARLTPLSWLKVIHLAWNEFPLVFLHCVLCLQPVFIVSLVLSQVVSYFINNLCALHYTQQKRSGSTTMWFLAFDFRKRKLKWRRKHCMQARWLLENNNKFLTLRC